MGQKADPWPAEFISRGIGWTKRSVREPCSSTSLEAIPRLTADSASPNRFKEGAHASNTRGLTLFCQSVRLEHSSAHSVIIAVIALLVNERHIESLRRATSNLAIMARSHSTPVTSAPSRSPNHATTPPILSCLIVSEIKHFSFRSIVSSIAKE